MCDGAHTETMMEYTGMMFTGDRIQGIVSNIYPYLSPWTYYFYPMPHKVYTMSITHFPPELCLPHTPSRNTMSIPHLPPEIPCLSHTSLKKYHVYPILPPGIPCLPHNSL